MAVTAMRPQRDPSAQQTYVTAARRGVAALMAVLLASCMWPAVSATRPAPSALSGGRVPGRELLHGCESKKCLPACNACRVPLTSVSRTGHCARNNKLFTCRHNRNWTAEEAAAIPAAAAYDTSVHDAYYSSDGEAVVFMTDNTLEDSGGPFVEVTDVRGSREAFQAASLPACPECEIESESATRASGRCAEAGAPRNCELRRGADGEWELSFLW